MIHKLTRTIVRTFAFALALCVTTSAWADTDLETTVVGTTFTINNENAKSFNKGSQHVSSPKLTIPASTELPKGSLVSISAISFGTRDGSPVYPNKIQISVDDANYISDARASDSSVKFTCRATGATSVKQTYSFVGKGCQLIVGKTYNIALLNGDGNTILGNSSLNMALAEYSGSLFNDTIQYGVQWRPVQEITGTIIRLSPIYKAEPSGTSVSLNDLTWSLDDEAASFPNDPSSSILEVTLDDGATLTIDKDISELMAFRLKGTNAKLLFADDAYVSSDITWDFSGLSGSLTVEASGNIDSDPCIKPWLTSGPAKMAIEGNGITATWSGDTRFRTHTTFEGGESSLSVNQSSDNFDVCNNSSNDDPVWRVKDSAALTLIAKDLGGWSANQKAKYCVIAVDDGGKLVLENYNTSTFYYQGRFLLSPGAELNIGTMSGNDRLRLNGGVNDGYEQIYVPDQNSDAMANPSLVTSAGNANSRVNAYGNGFGVYVGENAKLDWSASLSANGSAKVMKSGAGTLCIKNMPFQNYVTGSEGTIELYADSNLNHSFMSSPFTGVIKVTTQNGAYQLFGHTGTLSSSVFSDRPTLVANGDIRIYKSPADKPFTVKNMSGSGYFRNENTYDDANVWKYVDTLQTTDTTYDGVFKVSSNDNFVNGSPALTVRGDSELHSLTLTGASDTTGPLTIENNAKVVFSSTGKWSGGTVTVKNGGVLESQNSAAIAANLKVEEGATLKFASGVELLASNYDWTSVSTDESVNIDLSAVAPSATPVTLIASGVGVTSDKFTVTAAQRTATLSVDNGALKATFPNFWRDGSWLGSLVADDDATLYISQDSTLTVSGALSLGTVTVVKEGEDDVTLTISGAGALTTGGWSIPEGVTVNTPASMSISGTVSGDGVINVPANTTLAMNGVTCSAKVTVSGTLETSGTTTLSAANTSAAGSLIHVVGGKTVLSTAQKGIKGNITIDSDAELQSDSSHDGGYRYLHIDYDGSSCIDIAGKLNMDNCAWFLGVNNVIKLRDGANVTGYGRDGNNYGNWAWVGPGNIEAYGDSTLDITINTASGISPVLTISQDATLKITKAFTAQNGSYYAGGSITKAGAGTLDLTTIVPTKPITINAGTVVASTDPAYASFANMTINPNGTFTLKDVAWTGGATKFSGGDSGSGTLRLLNTTTTHRTHSVTGVTFDGTLDFRCTSTHSHIIGNTGFLNAGTVPQLALNTTGTSADFSHLFFAQTFDGYTWVVRDLTGEGSLCAKNSGKVLQNQTIQTKQTQNTIFSGNMICNDSGSDKAHTVNLAVVGDGTENTHSLTIRGVNTSIGELSVGAYAKVIFDGSGSWANGVVQVGANGVLESQNDANVASNLVLEAGSVLAYGNSSETIKARDALTLPDSGRVSVDVSSLTIGASEEKVLLTVDSGMNASKFSQIGHTETHMLTASGESLKLVPIAATLTMGSTTTPYATVNQAVGMLTTMGSDAFVTLVNGTPEDLSYTAEQLAEYEIVYDGTNGIYGRATAQIGANQYLTLATAFGAAAASGDTVTLLRDVTAVNIPLNDKSITLDENGKTFSGTLTGNGTIKMTAKPRTYTSATTNNGRLFAEGWTGTFQVAWNPGNERFVLDDFGNANSTVEIVGVNGAFGAFPFSQWNDGGAPNVQTKVSIAFGTTWTVSNGNSTLTHITTFSSLEGGGDLIVNGGSGSSERNLYYTLTRVGNYTGALSGSRCNYKIVNIVTSEDDFGDCLVKVGANFGPYELDQTTVNGEAANLCVDTLNSQKGIYKTAATVTVDATTTKYASVANAAAAGQSGTVTILADTDTVTVNPGQSVVVADGVTVGTISWGDEYAIETNITGDGTTPYASTAKATTYYWKGPTGSAWATVGNWAVNAADGPTATRAVTSIDSVVFKNGDSVSCAAATVRCAGMTINGNVTLTGANGNDIALGGNITGTGVLTLDNACLKNSLAEVITVANTVEVHFTSDSEIAASQSVGITFNGPVSISESDTIKAWDAVHRVAGTTTLSGNFTKAGGGFELTLGNVVVSASTTPTISAGTLAINGAVTVSDGATFTIPASGLTVGDSASFVLSGRSSVLVDNGSGASGKVSTSLTDGAKVVSTTAAGVTTYKVVSGTIFSVY